MLLRLLPFVLMAMAGLAVWHFSARTLLRQLSAQSVPLTDPGLAPMLERLRAALGVAALPVHVYQVPQVNGLAAPDGRVFLTEGFMGLYRAGQVTPAELASVIAHELGHVAHGHARRRMIDVTGHDLLGYMLLGLLGRVIPILGPWLANLILAALMAHLRQRDEFEADTFATALLLKSGIGVDGQISLFAKLDRLTGAQATAPAWLLSHPATPARIDAIHANLRRWDAA